MADVGCSRGHLGRQGKISYRSHLFSLAPPSPTLSAFRVACLGLSGPPRSSQDRLSCQAPLWPVLCCRPVRAVTRVIGGKHEGSQVLGPSEEGRLGGPPCPVAASFTRVGAARDEEGRMPEVRGSDCPET